MYDRQYVCMHTAGSFGESDGLIYRLDGSFVTLQIHSDAAEPRDGWASQKNGYMSVAP